MHNFVCNNIYGDQRQTAQTKSEETEEREKGEAEAKAEAISKCKTSRQHL